MSDDLTMPDLDPAHVEAVARALFRWNTPTDPHFVIHGRAGVVEDRDPYEPIAEAILTSTDPAVHAALLAALAPVIEARVREARADALTEVADSLYVSATNVERANGGATERTKFMRYMVDVLRNRAREVRR